MHGACQQGPFAWYPHVLLLSADAKFSLKLRTETKGPFRPALVGSDGAPGSGGGTRWFCRGIGRSCRRAATITASDSILRRCALGQRTDRRAGNESCKEDTERQLDHWQCPLVAVEPGDAIVNGREKMANLWSIFVAAIRLGNG